MSVRKSLRTSLRITSDIWSRNEGGVQLFPSSALQIVDHHLHASGIIPRKVIYDSRRVYGHDWYCVSQSVTCFPLEDLIHKSLDECCSSHSHVWVQSVGNSSLQLGSAITMDDQVLATARRVFIRKNNGRSAPFSDTERSRFWEDCALDETIAFLDHNAEHPLPLLERFGTVLPKQNPSELLLKVTVGPQHTNFGNHADHAFLAETAVHAMTLAKLPVESVAINYMSEGMLGHELECIVHDDQVFVVRSVGDEGQQVLVLVARAVKL
jgi:hypothetical protein